MSVMHKLRTLLWKAGYEFCRITPATHAFARRGKLLSTYRVDTVLDVGANTGGFGLELREHIGYKGRLISFEPMAAAFAELKKHAAGDARWEVLNCALGDSVGRQEINVAGNSSSSSLLDMLPLHVEKAPHSRYVSKETIEVKTLDSIFEELCSNASNVYLKIDTQGFEGRVLKGAGKSLARIDSVQLEMSLVPLYDGEMAFGDLYAYMLDLGYRLVSVEPGFVDQKTGQVMQIDGIFHRAGR
jgi:FkbM family methyltransferase